MAELRHSDPHRNTSAYRARGTGEHPVEDDPFPTETRVGPIGLEPAKFSGHSLRAGFVTSAARAGIATHLIRQQTGHASDATMSRYIREGSLFRGNAAGQLL